MARVRGSCTTVGGPSLSCESSLTLTISVPLRKPMLEPASVATGGGTNPSSTICSLTTIRLSSDTSCGISVSKTRGGRTRRVSSLPESLRVVASTDSSTWPGEEGQRR